MTIHMRKNYIITTTVKETPPDENGNTEQYVNWTAKLAGRIFARGTDDFPVDIDSISEMADCSLEKED